MGFKSQKQKVKTHCKECGKQARPIAGDDGEAGWILNLGADDCVCGIEDTTSNLESRSTECQTESEEQTVPAEGNNKNEEPIPDLIANRFKVLKQVGKGGMGAVYKVFDQETDTVVALKLLHQKLSEDVAALKRFEKEAEAAAQLDHPNLVPVYAHGITETGRAYLIMEYVEGKSLADVIDEEGSLLEQRAINILLQICEALSQAHEHNIIHRDIKPSNILLSRTADGEEVVRVVDFGIAKTLASDDRETRDLTQTGEVFGSPQYMSPEQCLGFMLDQRSDIYSLGCLMYETLTGKPPFAGDNAIQLVIKHMNERPASFAKLDGSFGMFRLESITLKCLEKQQADRPQSVKEITEVLINAKTGKTTAGDYWNSFAGPTHRKFSRQMLLIFGILMPSIALFALYKDYSVTDNSATTFAMLFGLLSFVCAFFAALVNSVTKKMMVREDAWTINSLVFSMIGFACLIPVTVSTWFEVGHRYDAVKLNLHLWYLEPIIVIGMFVSGVCGLIALGSVLSLGLELFMGRARKKATNRTLYSISGLSLIVSIVVSATLLALPGIGDKWLMTSIVDRTADVPVELGQKMRMSILEHIVSRVPADQAIPDQCLNAYSRMNNFPKEIALTSLSLTKPNLKKLHTASLLHRRGFAYERLNNLEAAVSDYTKASEFDPDDTYSPLRKANCLYKLGRPFAALVELDKLHVLSPDSTAAYYLEAKILQDMNNTPAALNCVDRRMALSYGRTPFALVFKSILLEKLGRSAEAKQNLQRIKEIDDDDNNDYFLWKVLKAVIYKDLGDSFNSRKKLESITQHDRVEALRYSAHAVDDFPNEMISKIRDILPNDDTIRVLFPQELHGPSQHVPSR